MTNYPAWAERYREVFRRDTFHLLKIGYDRARPQIAAVSDEPEISSRIADAMDDVLLEAPARYDRYVVQPEKPQRSDIRFGSRRRRIDIVVGKRLPGRTATFSFEAKRLRRPSHTLRQYLGEDGLLLFVTGEYAPADAEAAMLGYVQDSTLSDWYERLGHEIRPPRATSLSIVGSPKFGREGPFRLPVPSTLHRRTGNRPIKVFHLFLDCS